MQRGSHNARWKVMMLYVPSDNTNHIPYIYTTFSIDIQ